METRSRASPEQFMALLEFMERHGDLSKPQEKSRGRLKATRLWNELATMLNSMGGGVTKTTENWKKVWVDWKAKTKKKALALPQEATGIGGGPSSRQSLTAPEKRVLNIIGLTTVVGQVAIEKRGLEVPLLQPNTPSPGRDSDTTVDIQLDCISTCSVEATTSISSVSEVSRFSSARESTPQFEPFTSPVATTSRAAQRRQRRSATPSQMASPGPSTPHTTKLLRARTRSVRTPFEIATNEFVAVENRRLQLEETRERNNHLREMERLRLQSLSMEMEENRNQIVPLLQPNTPSLGRDSDTTVDVQLDCISTCSLEATTSISSVSEVSRFSSARESTPQFEPFTSPVATTSRAAQRRQRRSATPSQMSPGPSTPHTTKLLRARTRRERTPFEIATNELVAIENRRLQEEETCERNNHLREMERLRLQSLNIEMEANRYQIVSNLVTVLNNFVEVLPTLRIPSS